MKKKTLSFALLTCLPLLCLSLCGCSKSVAFLDKRDRSDALMQQAKSKQDAGNIEDALSLYIRAVEKNPGLARAHLDIALIYHDHNQDYIRAIYHYQRYLELRPETEKRQMILDRIRLARQMLTASNDQPTRKVSTRDDSKKLYQQIMELEKEVGNLQSEKASLEAVRNNLQKQNQQLKQELLALRASPPSSPPPEPAPEPAPIRRTYRVERGDSLSKIATKVYGDPSKWRKIYDANRDSLKESNRIKIGQILVVP